MRLSHVKPMAKKQRKKLEKVLLTKAKKAHVRLLCIFYQVLAIFVVWDLQC